MKRRHVREEYSSDESSSGECNVKQTRWTDQVEIVNTIERLMLKLSCHCAKSVENRLEDLSFYVLDHLESCKRDVLRVLVDCASKRPMQSSVYATFVGLLNSRNFNFGGNCVKHLTNQLHDALRCSQWETALNLIIMLADLVNTNVITISSLLCFQNMLLDACEEKDGEPQLRSDWCAYAVMATLPLVGRELYEKKESQLDLLMLRLEIYIKRRSSVRAPMLRIWTTDTAQCESVELLWQQLLRLRRDNWIEQLLPRPYLPFDDRLSEALQHKLPSVKLPPHAPDLLYACPRVPFNLFDITDCPTDISLPDAQSIERYWIQSQILETLQLFHLERKLCVHELLSYAEFKSTLAVDHIIVEVLLGQLLQLPKSHYLTINYGSIIVELCKTKSTKIPQVVAQAVHIIYNNLDSLHVACLDRLVNWFSYHLSNFGFEWNWNEWLSAAGMHRLQKQPVFVRELLQKCLRLSYHQHIIDIVPESFGSLLPVAPEPHFKYIDELLPGAQLAKQLLVLIRQKCTAENVGGTIEATTQLDDLLKINVLMQTILHLGIKSLTHTFVNLNKFQPVLQVLATDEAAQHAMLTAIFELWRDFEQRKVIMSEKLLKLDVVSANAMISYIFSDALKEELCKSYMWELLYNTIRYTNYKLCQEEQMEKMKKFKKIKPLFLNVVQRIVTLMAKHQHQCDPHGTPDYWFDWMLGRLLELLYSYWSDVQFYAEELRELAIQTSLCPLVCNQLWSFLGLLGQSEMQVAGGNQNCTKTEFL